MELLQKIRALPDPVQDYLYGETLAQAVGEVFERHAIDLEGQRPLMQVLQRVIAKEIPLQNLQKEAAAALAMDEEKAKPLARDIAGYWLLPLDRWLGDVVGTLRSLGGETDAYPTFRVPILERTRDEAAGEVVKAVAAPSSRTKERLHDIVESFLAGVRTEEQAREVLTRPEKIGGAGLDAAAAANVLAEAKEESRSVVITERKPLPAPAPVAQASAVPEPPAPVAPPPPPKPKDDFSTIKPEDEAEIEQFKQVVLPAKGVEQADETARRIEASIEEIYQASGLKTDDEAMAKRVKTVIGNRLRDVRDQMETLETMVQPKELGGLGMGQDAARALLNAIQWKLKQVHDEHAVQAMTEKTEWVEKEKQHKVESETREKQGDQTDLERLYSSIVSKSKKAMKNAPPSPLPTPAAPAPAAPPSLMAPPNLPIATTNPVPPELRAPAVVPLPTPAPAPAPTLAAPPLTIVRPTPGVPVMPQIRGGMDAPKPRMDDVKPIAKITGPVEELRAITVVDFRRLSKVPTEACQKIKEKIDVLAEQSYTRRNEAIAAWGASEVVRTYLELMGEGLNGIPLKDAIAARQAARKPHLTPEEFQAVAALSRQLRY